DEFGVSHDTWWLVDNGVYGADGVARTSSPPYPGVRTSGSYMVATTKVQTNQDTGQIDVTQVTFNWDAFWAEQAGFAMAAPIFAAMPFGSGTGIHAALDLLSLSHNLSVVKYTLDGAFRAPAQVAPGPNGGFTINVPLAPMTEAQQPSVTQVDFDA